MTESLDGVDPLVRHADGRRVAWLAAARPAGRRWIAARRGPVSRTLLAASVVGWLVACAVAGPVVWKDDAQIAPEAPAPASPVAPRRVTAWSSGEATVSLRAALDRRGLPPDVVDGPMLAERFLPLGPPGLPNRALPAE